MTMELSKPIIFGANGFLGRHFIKTIGMNNCLPISRIKQTENWGQADLLIPETILPVLNAGKTVINLAYSYQVSPADNIQMAKNLVESCHIANINKVIHCSTAVVIGRNKSNYIDETTPCYPETIYEKTKYEIEKIFLEASNDKLNIFILRPTAIIGTDGQNLKKMLNELRNQSSFYNFLRAALYGSRKLNLISVQDVVQALIHLSKASISPGIYICAADDDPLNAYDKVKMLMENLIGRKPFSPRIAFPGFVLALILRLGRSGSGRIANRHYSAKKLYDSGFHSFHQLNDAITEFVVTELGR